MKACHMLLGNISLMKKNSQKVSRFNVAKQTGEILSQQGYRYTVKNIRDVSKKIRYVGIIRFVFHVIQLLIIFKTSSAVTLANHKEASTEIRPPRISLWL